MYYLDLNCTVLSFGFVMAIVFVNVWQTHRFLKYNMAFGRIEQELESDAAS
jgi:hypothetical protein